MKRYFVGFLGGIWGLFSCYGENYRDSVCWSLRNVPRTHWGLRSYSQVHLTITQRYYKACKFLSSTVNPSEVQHILYALRSYVVLKVNMHHLELTVSSSLQRVIHFHYELESVLLMFFLIGMGCARVLRLYSKPLLLSLYNVSGNAISLINICFVF